MLRTKSRCAAPTIPPPACANNSEGVAIILDLLDQIHGLRRTLRRANSVIIAQDSPVRERIMYEALRTP